MFGSNILDVAIGLIFIYLLLSVIASVINEGISTIWQIRGKNLFDGIKNLLNDPKFTGLAQQIYNHGLVDAITQDKPGTNQVKRLPSYMPCTTFSLALIDLLGVHGVARDANNTKLNDLLLASNTASAKVTGAHDIANIQTASEALAKLLSEGRAIAAAHPDPLANIKAGLAALPDGHTKQSLSVLIDKTRRQAAIAENKITNVEGQVEKLQENIETWFNDSMDRVSGWYKRWTQWMLLAIAFIVVISANADTIQLAQRLTRDSALRSAVVTAAQDVAKMPVVSSASPTDKPDARVQNVLTQANALSLPLGWKAAPNLRVKNVDDIRRIFLRIVGLLLTVLAVSMGSPFWFDTLSKFVNMRGAGTPPGDTKKSATQPKP